MKKKYFLVALICFSIDLAYAQTTYSPVDAESKVHFVIKNFAIRTGGDFSGLKGTVKFDPANMAGSSFDVTVEANTVDTDNSSRDKSLRSTEYFDVERFTTLRFTSTKIALSTVAGRFYVFGNLTIKGVTKPVEFGFSATPKNGGYFFEGEFKINRRDFGVGGSSISLSDNLNVSLEVFAK